MSNGGEETYEVIYPGFNERHGGIPAHYQMDVKNLGLSEAKKITRRINSLAKNSENLESVDITETQNMIKLFVSHSSKDQELVEELIELVKNALRLSSSEIRCTTVDGSRLPGGANTNEQLKREVHDAKAFIGLISFAATDSIYVLFELGARWGADKHLLPLLAPGVSSDILKGPLSGLNALRCDNRSQLHQSVEELAKILEIKPEPPQAYQRYIDKILAISPLEEKILLVDDRVEAGNTLVLKNSMYYQESGDGPFCTGCYDTARKVVRLVKQRAPFDEFGEYMCPSCKVHYNSST